MFDIGDSPEKEIEADYTADLLKAVDIAEKTYLDRESELSHAKY